MAGGRSNMMSKILLIGGSGYIGKFMVEASVKAGHPTFLLIRDSTLSNPAKSSIINKFKDLSVYLVVGDLYDHQSLVKAIKQVDVVISTVSRSHLSVGSTLVPLMAPMAPSNSISTTHTHITHTSPRGPTHINGQDLCYGTNGTISKSLKYFPLSVQDKIISAIKEAGNVKRFFPSEFGNDVDRSHAVEPAKSAYAVKARIRRSIEAEGIPYTYVSSNYFAGYFLPSLSQHGASAPPRDKVVILGDGNPKAVFNKEEDIATYTIKSVDDPRTLNKILYIRPPGNALSFNDLVSLWEKKIGKTLERIYVPEEQLLKQIQESSPPLNMMLSIAHCVYIKGDHTNFEIDPNIWSRSYNSLS